MSEHKFTPGPWTVREVDGQGFAGQIGYAIDFNEDQEQVVDFVYEEADAHLIAAAPDLLEALSSAEVWISAAPHGDDCFVSSHSESDPGNRCNCGKDSVLEFIGAAIAKAFGNQ